MKALKKILVGVVLFIGVLLVVGLFMPSNIELERSRVINAPIEMIYDQVNNLHLWEHWSPWHKIDPNMKISYDNNGLGEGASYSWTSNHNSVGNGSLTILEAKPFEYIKTIMNFGEQGVGTAGFTFKQEDNGVIVSWDMQSDLGKNPFMHLMGVMMKKSIKNSYDRGLEDIEKQCEYLKENGWFHVKLEEQPTLTYYGITSRNVTMETMETTMQESYAKLGSGLGKNAVDITGTAFALYHTWGKSYNMECAFPVKNNSKIIKGLEQNELPKHKYAVLKYEGDYIGLEAAHGYLMQWVGNMEYELAGPVIEKYDVGPQNEQDPNQWITYLLYPVN